MLYAAAESVLTVPYVLNGADKQGWDCRGCVAWSRRSWLGLGSPGMDGWYPVEQAENPDFVARAIQDRVSAWVRCDPKPGAVVLLKVGERVAHVGLMLDTHNFLHARRVYGTCVDTLQKKAWLRRFEGAYELR